MRHLTDKEKVRVQAGAAAASLMLMDIGLTATEGYAVFKFMAETMLKTRYELDKSEGIRFMQNYLDNMEVPDAMPLPEETANA